MRHEIDCIGQVGTIAAIAGGLALLAAATGAAFGAWLQHGAAIFLAMAEAGLAWCSDADSASSHS